MAVGVVRHGEQSAARGVDGAGRGYRATAECSPDGLQLPPAQGRGAQRVDLCQPPVERGDPVDDGLVAGHEIVSPGCAPDCHKRVEPESGDVGKRGESDGQLV